MFVSFFMLSHVLSVLVFIHGFCNTCCYPPAVHREHHQVGSNFFRSTWSQLLRGDDSDFSGTSGSYVTGAMGGSYGNDVSHVAQNSQLSVTPEDLSILVHPMLLAGLKSWT